MEKLPICKIEVVSPMFSYGNKQLEPRPTELKGLIRNTYRIANPYLGLSELYKNEMGLFGGQIKEKDDILIKSSPLRIQILEGKSKLKTNRQKLRLHHDEEYWKDGRKLENKLCDMYELGTVFDVNLLLNLNVDFSSISFIEHALPIQWYENLIYLALLIGGIGKRSRRGRGSMTVEHLKNIEEPILARTIVDLLNKVSGHQNYILLSSGNIKLTDEKQADANRPYIKEICFGKILKNPTAENVNSYLESVDIASHYIKGKDGSRNIFRWPYATGFISPRFASSVIVSLAQIKDGIIPIYTLLHAVDIQCKIKNSPQKKIYFKNVLHEQCDFIKMIEKEREKYE